MPDDKPVCRPCSYKGISRLATHTLDMLGHEQLYVCDVCRQAFPVSLRIISGAFHELPHAEEARRLNKTAEVSVLNRSALRKDR